LNTYTIDKKVEPFKGTDVPMLTVANAANQTVFKMPIRWQLVFAMTSFDKLWLLEDTPHGIFSVEANLTSGMAKSYRMEGKDMVKAREFQYHSSGGKDRWETVD